MKNLYKMIKNLKMAALALVCSAVGIAQEVEFTEV
jgi:hypothetical protein